MRKATVSFLMSVRPSVRIEQLGSHWQDLHEIWYSSVFKKSIKKIKFSWKSYKNNGYFTWRPTYFFNNISLSSSLNEKCFRQKFQRKSKHPILFKNLPLKSCRLWDNVKNYCTAGQATGDMGHVHCHTGYLTLHTHTHTHHTYTHTPHTHIHTHTHHSHTHTHTTHTTHTHTKYVILIASPLQQLLQERASILHSTYITCLVWEWISSFSAKV